MPILLVFAFHGFFYLYSKELLAKARSKNIPIHVVINKKETPKPKPPPIEAPKPKPKPKPKPAKKPAPPKPNVADQPPEPPKKLEPPKPVFGVTDSSVSDQGSGVAVRVGNTLNKEMEKEYIDPSKIKPLPPAPVRKSPVPVYELSRMPKFKNRVIPEYSAEARRKEIEGVVELEITISETGKVLRVRITKKLGYGLDEAAVKAVKQSTFHPALKGKKKVPVKIRIPYRFVLED